MGKKWVIVGGVGLLVMWGVFQSDNLDAFVTWSKQKETIAFQTVQEPETLREPAQAAHSLPMQSVQSVLTEDTRTKLLERIKQEAESRKQPAIDAKLDRVWKAIPGLNGREVDVEATWKRAIELSVTSGHSFPLLYKDIPPSVRLDDLGAQPIYKGNPNKPMVALMINVAWGDEYITKMLDILEQQQVKATFFLDGSWLNKTEATALVIMQKGHELSNHAYSHKNMSQISRQQNVDEISKTQKLLDKLGVSNKLFAPPSGDFNDQTVKVASELGLRTILWTIDTVDWKNPGAEAIVRRITPRLEPGAMILMHPTQSSSEALEQLIRNIKAKGFVLGTVSELISPERVPVVEEPIKF